MVTVKRKWNGQWIAGSVGFALVLALGFFLPHLNLPLGQIITRASYDWCFDLNWFQRPNVRTGDVVIVYLDEQSHKDLGQPLNRPWDREIHARLLRRLKQDGAKAVIFDILFTDPGPNPASDQALADAIRSQGTVILAAEYMVAGKSSIKAQEAEVTKLSLPLEKFQQAAAGWGLDALHPDSDFIVREHYHGPPDEDYVSMSWAAARMTGLPLTKRAGARTAERWVNYYGGPETVPSISYSRALFEDGAPPGFFRNKYVFVGARPITGNFIERRDEMRTTFSTWRDQFIFMPAVEVHATELLNLLRGDWLRRTPPVAELMLSAIVALLFGFGLTRLRPPHALLLSLVGIAVCVLAALILFGKERIWFPWMVVTFIQIPAAFVWSVAFKSIEWWVQKRHLETERRQAEHRIREQAALLDKAQDAIFVHDFQWRLLYCNKSAERLYGWGLEELSWMFEKVLKSEGGQGLTRALQAVRERGEWSGELRQPTREHGDITVDSRWTLLRDEHDKPKGVLVINTDITEKKKADRKIREQAALLDKAQDAIFVQDKLGTITYWNKSAERLYGWTDTEMTQTGNALGFFALDESKITAAREAVTAKGEWTGELRQKNKSGAEVIVDSRWTLVTEESGATRSILCINTDITERKKIEAQFLRSQRMESIGTLAGGIAHDLNNVLAPILMGAELLAAKPMDARSAKLLATIEASAKRGRDMVKQVLTFARGQTGEKAVLQLGSLIKEMDKIMKETFPKNISSRVALGADLWPIVGDPTQLHQVLLNLCVNARDAMPDGGDIILEAANVTLDQAAADQLQGARPGQFILLTATDTGTGMPPEILAKIFEPFFTTKEVGKGTGLGLSTTMSIIKSHDGILDVVSQVGRGTSFKIYLPADPSVSLVTPQAPDRAKLQGKGELILAVDDEPAVRDLLEATLTENGYRLLTAKNGAEALTVCSAAKEPIALVLMDMMMPVMSGTTALKTIRRQHPHLPSVAMSGLQQGDKIREQLGELPFLAKPFTTDQLLETLQRALASRNN